MLISDWSSDVCSSHLLGVDDAALAADPRPVGAVLAVALDREDGVDAVRLAQVEIILAMVGRHMDEAGAAVGGDEIAREEGAGAGVEFQRAFPILVIPAFAGMTKVVVDRVAGDGDGEVGAFERSEERSVGKGCVSRCRARGSPYH